MLVRALIGVPPIVDFTLSRVKVSGKYSRKAYWRIMEHYGIITLVFLYSAGAKGACR